MTTFPLNVLYGLWCGGCLAACAAPRVVPGAVAWSQLIKLPLLFAVLSVVPAATSLAGQFPDWSFMYLVDPQRLPRLWIVGAGLVSGAAVALGFALGMTGYRRHGARPLGVALGVIGLAYLALCALGWRSSRLALVGSFADFHSGGWLMQPVFPLAGWRLGQRPAGLLYALVATNLGVGIALLLVARTLLTKSEFIFAGTKGLGAFPSETASEQPRSKRDKPGNHRQS